MKAEPKSYSASFARKYLVVEGFPCQRHCARPTRFSVLFEDSDRLVGAYLCPSNYVSRIVSFAETKNYGDVKWFQNFIRSELLEGSALVRDKDFRVATRHGWELGGNAEEEINKFSSPAKGVVEYYWTFYPISEEEKKLGNFLCEKCGKLFTQPLASENKICPRH